MKFTVFRHQFALLLCVVGSTALAQDLATIRWDYELAHYPDGMAPDAWVISQPARDSVTAKDLAAVLDTISRDPNSSIAHFYLPDPAQLPETQESVMEYVSAQPEFQKHPPPGSGRWKFNSAKMRALIAKGMMNSRFVADCNVLLGKYGKSIRDVGMEELFFTKTDGRWIWHAMMWLTVYPRPTAAPKQGE